MCVCNDLSAIFDQSARVEVEIEKSILFLFVVKYS